MSADPCTVLVRLPARERVVTEPAVRAVLARLGPRASQREVRTVLGGGSLRDIARVLKTIRSGGLTAEHAALRADADLAPVLVAALERLQAAVAKLQPAPTAPQGPALARRFLQAIEGLDKRWQQRMAASTHAPTRPSAPTEPAGIAVLHPVLHGIEVRLAALSEDLARERRMPSTPVLDPTVLDVLHARLDALEAAFARHTAALADAAARPLPPAVDLTGLHQELKQLRLAQGRMARQHDRQLATLQTAIADSRPKPTRRKRKKVIARPRTTAKPKVVRTSRRTAPKPARGRPKAKRPGPPARPARATPPPRKPVAQKRTTTARKAAQRRPSTTKAPTRRSSPAIPKRAVTAPVKARASPNRRAVSRSQRKPSQPTKARPSRARKRH